MTILKFKDLTKGLIKVLDKEFEPLIVALLCDLDAVECERIYESLYVRLAIKRFLKFT